ncbi:MAG: hypothetical protein WBA17_11405 [Saprospiraceae bacterium]
MKYLSLFILLFTCSFLIAQQQATTKVSGPRTYAGAQLPDSEEARMFDAAFPEKEVGLLHVYADEEVQPSENYLLEGVEIGSGITNLLPGGYRRLAAREGTTAYAAGAIRGDDENLYLVRMASPTDDRIELFAFRGDRVKLIKTLAYRKCRSGRCAQLDSYILDINRDGLLDVAQLIRKRPGMEPQRRAYLMSDTGKLRKDNSVDVPWDSMELYEGEK